MPSRSRLPRFLLLLALPAIVALLALRHFLASPPADTPIGDRSLFTQSACIRFDPTGGTSRPAVFIDPGHGGPDPGVTSVLADGAPIAEKTVTLAVADRMLPLLRRAGYTVVLSRTADSSVIPLRSPYAENGLYTLTGEHADLVARVACADAAHAALLLSIHFNSFADPTVGGAETLYDDARPFTQQNLRFADLVQKNVLAALQTAGWTIPDRGVIADSEAGTPALTPQGAAYGHLLELGPPAPGWLDHPSSMPGALCEPLFLTDPAEARIAESAAGQEVLARAFVTAIEADLR